MFRFLLELEICRASCFEGSTEKHLGIRIKVFILTWEYDNIFFCMYKTKKMGLQ